jgi:hypothetical protein
VEDALGAPRFGTYQGNLTTLDLKDLRGAWQLKGMARWLTHKRWLYGFVGTHEVAVLFATIDLGYASSSFAMAVDLGRQQVVAEGSALGLPAPQVHLNTHPGAGLDTAFRHPRLRARAWRAPHETTYRARVRLGALRRQLALDVDLRTDAAGPALTVIAPVDGGLVNVTQKWAGLAAGGELRAGGRTYSLEGGVGGLDVTCGYLARHTAWRWAFACGRLPDGTALGLNLVEGFNEADEHVNENAVWLGRALFPVGRARFHWNHDDVLDRWRVTTEDGAVQLTFRPIAAHREDRDLVLVRSRFAQPLGTWEGTVTVSGRTYQLAGIPGVTESQEATW